MRTDELLQREFLTILQVIGSRVLEDEKGGRSSTSGA